MYVKDGSTNNMASNHMPLLVLSKIIPPTSLLWGAAFRDDEMWRLSPEQIGVVALDGGGGVHQQAVQCLPSDQEVVLFHQ